MSAASGLIGTARRGRTVSITSDGPTLRDVAERAGVSTGTVSNVLNHPQKVSEATIDRVRNAIDELGFVRNANASTLAAGRSRNLGLVVIDLGNSFFVDVARGAQRVARGSGFHLLLAGSDDDHALQASHVDYFDEARAAGLLLAPMQNSDDQLRRMREHQRPVVLLNYDSDATDRCCVVIDNEQVGYLTAKHLVSRGRQRILFAAGDTRFQPIRLRRAGVHRALAETPSVQLIEVASESLEKEAGADVVRTALQRGVDFDAVLGVTDLLAVGAIAALVEHGIDVPGSVDVVGSDHNSAAWGDDISLTTATMRGVEIGEEAMRLLLEELDDPDHEHRRVVLEPSLVHRSSSPA